MRMNQSAGPVHEALDGRGLGRKRRRRVGREVGVGAR